MAKSIYTQVAEIHMQALDQSFLSTLGVNFLALMYEAIDKSESGTLIIQSEGSEVIGFVTGSSSVGGVYREMWRYKTRLLISLLPCILSVRKLVRIIENVMYARRGGSVASMNLPIAELLTIAVRNDVRGKRIADQLFSDLVQHFAYKGVGQFKIIVGESLAPAHKFYRRMGSIPVGEVFLHGEARSIVYVQDAGKFGQREGF